MRWLFHPLLVCGGLMGLLVAAPAAAQSKPAAPPKTPAPAAAAPKTATAAQPAAASADLDAIRAGSDAYVKAFNQGQAKEVAALWAKDCEFVDSSGLTTIGRDAIEKAYTQFFAEHPQAKIQIAIDSLRLLGPAAAIEDGRTLIESAGAATAGKYTAVHVKADGQWRVASVRESPVETSAAAAHLADLDWLIGTWSAEEYGTRTDSVCRWVADGSFVERTYTATHADGTKSSGVQLIGWSPEDECVESWDFSAGGGSARGAWQPQPGGWQAEVRGRMPDGTPTTAVNRLTRLDDNAYVWQSTQRSVGGRSLPDTDEVVIKRVTAAH
jgi:uncharacterized protein (TIGR02246 family)